MERKIGEVFECNGVKLRVEPDTCVCVEDAILIAASTNGANNINQSEVSVRNQADLIGV